MTCHNITLFTVKQNNLHNKQEFHPQCCFQKVPYILLLDDKNSVKLDIQ